MAIGEQNLARNYLYSFLSCAFADPISKRFQVALQENIQRAAAASANLLSVEIDMARIVNWLRPSHKAVLVQHQNLFGLTVATRAPANETEYCHAQDITYRSQQIADIAGFYQAFRFETNPFGDELERPDHISLELGFMGFLTAKEILANSEEKIQICRDAQRDFFSHHLAWWVPAFVQTVKNETESCLYTALVDALLNFVLFEHVFLGIGETQTCVGQSYCQATNCKKCSYNCEE